MAQWWRARSDAATDVFPAGAVLGKVQLTPNGVAVTCGSISQAAGK
jgi:hypothetical protein